MTLWGRNVATNIYIYIYIHIYLFKKHSGSPLKSREAITWRTIRTAGPLKGKGSLRAEAYRSIFLSMPRFMPKFDVRRCSGVKISPNQGAVKAATPMLLTMFCMHTLRTYVYLYLQHVYICVKCTCIYYHVYSYFHIQPSASAANSSSPHQSNHLHCPLSWHGGYMGISQGIELAGWFLHNMYLLYVVIVPCVQDIFNTFSAQHLQRWRWKWQQELRPAANGGQRLGRQAFAVGL